MTAMATAPAPSTSMQQERQQQEEGEEEQKNLVFHSLCTTPLPQKELEELQAMRNNEDDDDHQEIMAQVNIISTKLTQWLSVAHMTVFTLEQSVKDDPAVTLDTRPLDAAMQQAQPVINAFVELSNEYDDDDLLPSMMKMTVAKIQSEWSGLQHFASSVTKTVNALVEERQLVATMDYVLLQLDDISLMIFQYHEKKAMVTPSTSFGTQMSSSTSSSTSNNTTATNTKDDGILVAIDERVEPVFREVERVYARMTSTSDAPADKSGMLARKHAMVQERWENLRSEIDDLKYGLKEDRWLTVFRQVADQVDVMIDGLEKTTAQCYVMIQQVRDRAATAVGGVPRPHGSTTSISSSSSSGSSHSHHHHPPVVVDQHKFRSAEKNFEAKYKYYTPSIDRMLAMLGNGIASRVGQDLQTTRRHQTMLQKWTQLKGEMDDLRMRDLPETERLLMADRPISPAWSRMSDRSDRSWKGYRSPEPPAVYDRSRSPYSRSTLSRTGSPLYDDRQQHGRSATPSSGMRSHSSIGSGGGSSAYNRTMSPPVVYGRQRTVSPLSFGSLLRPSTSDSSSVSSSSQRTDDELRKKSRVPTESFMKPTKSSTLRKQKAAATAAVTTATAAAASRQREASVRSATPNSSAHRYHNINSHTLPKRPMSSMDRVGSPTRLPVPYSERERAMSPVRRSGTPSLIPRPKTPSRAASPTPPRPRSSMAHNSPVPPVPKQQPQQPSAEHQRRILRKKQSMPALMHRSGSPAAARLLNARTPSPQYGYRRSSDYTTFSDDEEEEEGQDDYYYRRRTDNNYNDYDDEDDDEEYFSNTKNDNDNDLLTPSWRKQQQRQRQLQQRLEEHPAYRPDRKDPLDVEVANIVNASPIAIKCQKGPNGSGRYYFGSELSPSVGGGKKLYTCKLMSYTGGRRRHNTSNTDRAAAAAPRNKVLVRVGGGWQDLELFLLHYGILH
ncbi:hypothetical protein BDB00DRAFT_835242 [Zychaea mexicana]|uniref:uncharacterized protein n=1 Tax=Zychaea mexicana TaxID=64656 RepID=UPI0022FEC736|nr:uncharacterized protein BDB00DRAFT_835242 [Zychaea mexicana]KAI9490950.1 hypothetical protein BDB00DRAFT_835242 [Zychaea mexicana]